MGRYDDREAFLTGESPSWSLRTVWSVRLADRTAMKL
jgi:hypothetical protein